MDNKLNHSWHLCFTEYLSDIPSFYCITIHLVIMLWQQAIYNKLHILMQCISCRGCFKYVLALVPYLMSHHVAHTGSAFCYLVYNTDVCLSMWAKYIQNSFSDCKERSISISRVTSPEEDDDVNVTLSKYYHFCLSL